MSHFEITPPLLNSFLGAETATKKRDETINEITVLPLSLLEKSPQQSGLWNYLCL